MQRFTLIQTSEQAAFLYGLVKEHRTPIVGRTSFGFYDGLLVSLAQIDRGGGAVLRNDPLDYGPGIVEAAIFPAFSYIACLGSTPVPKPFELIGELPDLRYKALYWRRVALCRAQRPLAVIPLPAIVLPPLPLT